MNKWELHKTAIYDTEPGRARVLWFLLLSGLSAFILRVLLMQIYIGGGDMYLSFLPWFQDIVDNGRIASLSKSIGNYSPSYILLITLLTYIPFNPVFLIKLLSVAFDFTAAVAVYKVLKQKYRDSFAPLAGYVAVLFAPTVVSNSSIWGQCDIIYSSMLLFMIYYLIKKKYLLSVLFAGFAFSFKLQAIFVLPVLIYFIFLKKIRVKWLLLIPSVYMFMSLPSLISGRPLEQILMVYVEQSKLDVVPVLNAPNIYQWLPAIDFNVVKYTGIFLTAGIVLFILYKSVSGKHGLSAGFTAGLALLFSLVIPYFLPAMHERYFFAADVIVIIYVLLIKKNFHFAPLIWISSLCGYLNIELAFRFTLAHVGSIILFYVINKLWISLFRNYQKRLDI